MPALLISKVNDEWVATIANTQPPLRYRFFGADADAQELTMHYFARDMAAAGRPGGAAIEGEMDDYFDLAGQGSSFVYRQVLGLTDGIIFAGRPILTMIGKDVLSDELELAGRSLLDAVLAL